jgi:hypothetical protein
MTIEEDHHHHHEGPCFQCGSKLGHDDGKGLPDPDEQMENLIEAIHGSIKAEVNRAGGVYTRVLVPAAIEALLDLSYQEAMRSLERYGNKLNDVQELLKSYEQEIRAGFEDLWYQVLERNETSARHRYKHDHNNNMEGFKE